MRRTCRPAVLALPETWILAALIFLAASLYASVGHGGASGYLAAMALFGLAPEVMKPTALTLNVVVSLIAATRFARAGHFSWSTFWPFALGSIPLAYLGGALAIPAAFFKWLLGAILLFSAYRLLAVAGPHQGDVVDKPIPIAPAVASGAGIGFVSGLVGVGGGIFLSPLLLFTRWAGIRRTAAVSATFILVNSVAGLAGHLSSVRMLPSALPLWAAAAVLGGTIGSGLGSRRLAPIALRRLLGAVLAVAGAKLLLT